MCSTCMQSLVYDKGVVPHQTMHVFSIMIHETSKSFKLPLEA